MAQELNREEFHKLYFYNTILHHSQQYIAYSWLNKMWTAEVLFHLDHNFDVFFYKNIMIYSIKSLWKVYEQRTGKQTIVIIVEYIWVYTFHS